MIIDSLLDTDLYKFTMMQTVLHQFPSAMVRYRFTCRTKGVDLKPHANEIRNQIDGLCDLVMRQDELKYLRTFRFFKSDYIDFLRLFRFNRDFIRVETEPEFSLIIEGPWLHTILFEVPVLAIISEVICRYLYPKPNYAAGRANLEKKILAVKQHASAEDFHFSDFGTRRRFSKNWHEEVLQELKESLPENLTGTSNVALAKRLGLKAMGTMAHEYLEACQALGPRLALSQKFAFEVWAQEYRGELGIALSDVIGLDAFLRDFDLYFCKLFDGARHDSGDPFIWGDKLIEHYQKMRINPKTKTMVFSDNLNFPLALQLYDYFRERSNPVFGIGTNITNDLGHEPVQIVIKMVACNGQPVAKLTDEREKTICQDQSYLSYLKKVFEVDSTQE